MPEFVNKPVLTKAQLLKEIEEETPVGKVHLEIWKKYFLAGLLKKGVSKMEAEAKLSPEEVKKKIKRVFDKTPNAKVVELKAAVVTAPDYETATHWGYYYFQKVAQAAQAKGVPSSFLGAAKDVPEIFHPTVRDTLNASYVCGVGHGNESVYTGQNGVPLLQIGDLQTKLTSQNRIFHLLSCIVGKDLGKRMVESYKAKAFFGYRETYIFVIDEGAYPNSLASWFFNSDNAIDFAMLSGENCGTALQKALEAYDQAISQAPEACKPYLSYDKDILVFYGDPTATIDYVPPPPVTPPPSKKKTNLGPLCKFRAWFVKQVEKAYACHFPK